MRTAFKSLMTMVGLTILVSCSANQPSSSGSLAGGNNILDNLEAPIKNIGTLHGTVDSGGGRAVVCKDPQGKVQSIRQLDLYEADHTEKLIPAPAQGTLDDEWNFFAQRASIRLAGSNAYQTSLTAMLTLKNQFMKQARFVTEQEATLIPIDDSHEVFHVQGCQIVQLANWQDNDEVLVQKDLWDLMSPRDQAGLIAHEFIYDAYRKMGFLSSVYPRRLVGILFSTQPLTSLRSGSHKSDSNEKPSTAPKAPLFVCAKQSDPENEFDIDPRLSISFISPTQAKLKFATYPNQILLEKLKAVIDVPDVAAATLDCLQNAGQNDGQSKGKAAAQEQNSTINNEISNTVPVPLHTSYFKDEARLRLEVRCETHSSAKLSTPEITLLMKSQHGERESRYRCHQKVRRSQKK